MDVTLVGHKNWYFSGLSHDTFDLFKSIIMAFGTIPKSLMITDFELYV